MSRWPGVRDTHLLVAGRRLRVLRCEGPRHATAEPQLLVHGLGGSAGTWVQVIAGLAERGPVVAVDLPGFGRSPVGPHDPLTVDSYVELVLEVADTLGWQRFALHGNSMGGLIATLLAAREPRRVSHLVLVSPAFPPRSPVGLLRPSRATIDGMAPIAVSSASAAALGLVGLAGPSLDDRRNRALMQLIFPDPEAVDRDVLTLLAADLSAADGPSPSDRRAAMRQALWSITRLWADPRRVWRAIDRVQAPTLVLGGTADALVPARVLRQALARRRDWEGHVLDARRHALMLEDPESYLELVTDWQARTVAQGTTLSA